MTYDDVLEQVGNRRAVMLMKDFSHTDANGNDYGEQIAKEFGILNRYYGGEDIGEDGFNGTNKRTATELFTGLQDSPEHWNDVTRAVYTKVGVGLYNSPNGILYVAIEMGF